MTARIKAARLLALFAPLLLLAPALAQSPLEPDEPGDFSVDRFRFSSDGTGLLGVEQGPVRAKRFSFDAGGALHYLSDPLFVVSDSDGRLSPLLAHRAALDLFASMTIHARFSLGLSGRFVLYQSRPSTFVAQGLTHTLPTLTTTGPGDLRVVPKIWLLQAKDAFVDLSFMPGVWLPLGSGDSYLREKGAAFEPELVISKALGRLALAMNVSYLVRPRSELLNIVVDDELRGRLGLGYEVNEGGAALEASLLFATGTTSLGDSATTSLELLAGVRQPIGDHLQLRFAGGAGLLRGVGSPDLRFFTALRYIHAR